MILPSLIATGMFLSTVFAAVVGIVFIVGRAVYYVGYTQDPDKRGMGMVITFSSNVVLLLSGLVGVLLELG